MHSSFYVGLFCILQLALVTWPVISIPIDNEIIGSLNVTCQGGSALISFKTKNTFNGRVYVKGAYAKPQCNRDFSNAYTTNASQLEMPFGDCGMKRERMAGFERAFKYVSIIIVSFHPKFITMGDRAYRIECLYRSGEIEVTNSLNISDLTTESYTYRPPPPVCKYSLHIGNLTGPEATYARVGDSLFHQWNCDSGHFAIFVHSCYASGPGQEQIELLDEFGCALDDSIMPNLTYSKSMNESWVETHAFRYQDVESMRFNCKIKTCLKADTGCIENLPQKCVPYQTRRQKREFLDNVYFNDQLLFSPFVKFAEPFDDNFQNDWVNEPNEGPTTTNKAVCFDRPAAALLITATLTLFGVLLIMLTVISFRRRKSY